jgi:acyl dehydratase
MFASRNPIRTDRVFGSQSPCGACIAHGLLGLSVATGLSARLGVLDGTAIALLSVDACSFKQPIFFGDTIHARMTIVGKRETKHAGRGIVQRRFELINQNGAIVQEGILTTMVKRQGAD